MSFSQIALKFLKKARDTSSQARRAALAASAMHGAQSLKDCKRQGRRASAEELIHRGVVNVRIAIL
jgi:hypothetical protein